MNNNIDNKLSEIFKLVFELGSTSQVYDINQDNTDSWTSLSHVTLITAIENEFDIFLESDDAQAIISYTTCQQKINELLD